MAQFNRDKAVAYLQDGQFMGLVEEAGASEIKGSAKDAGYLVEDFGDWFNVVYEPIKSKAKTELLQYEVSK
jgi:hypothetical protein